MLKKVVLGLVAALGLATPFVAAPVADAAPHEHLVRVAHGRYEVLFRSCDRDPWRCEGVFENSHRDHEIAEQLHCRGFAVRIVDCR